MIKKLYVGSYICLSVVALLYLVSCTWKGAVWIEPNSTNSNLVFGVGKSRNSSGFIRLVDMVVSKRISTEPHWKWKDVWVYNGQDKKIRAVRYDGVVLDSGYYSVTVQLEGGRYGSTDFSVDKMGNITEQRVNK